MKSFYASLLPFIVLLLSSSCKKDNITPIDFTKYTRTDSSCAIIGEADITDWTADSIWTTSEIALMKFSDGVVLADSLIGFINVSPPCPNPSDGLFIMRVNTERECKMKVACVNIEMETLYYTSSKFPGGLITTGYDFRQLTAFHKDSYYRLYYAFYNAADSLFYKGHGDIKIE
jgi:hypothetical protein